VGHTNMRRPSFKCVRPARQEPGFLYKDRGCANKLHWPILFVLAVGVHTYALGRFTRYLSTCHPLRKPIFEFNS
jgi:hypothetical protein